MGTNIKYASTMTHTDISESFKHFLSTVTSFPRGYFSMTALNRLEVAAGISIIDKLAPKFVAMAAFLCIDASTMVTHRNNPHEELSGVFTKWFADKSPLPTTWQVLLEMLRDIELGELAQEIDDFFNINRTPTTLPSVHLVCCFII